MSSSDAARGSSRIARISREATIRPFRLRKPYRARVRSPLQAPARLRDLHRQGARRSRTPRGSLRHGVRPSGSRSDAVLEDAPERLVRRTDRQRLSRSLLPGHAEASAGGRLGLLERARRHPAGSAERARQAEGKPQAGRRERARARADDEHGHHVDHDDAGLDDDHGRQRPGWNRRRRRQVRHARPAARQGPPRRRPAAEPVEPVLGARCRCSCSADWRCCWSPAAAPG